MSDETTPGQRLDAALQRFQEQAATATSILTAQGAFGWMLRADLPKARKALAKLPAEQLAEISAAAAALSALADEIAAAPETPDR
ncbi:hypothetical protein [Nocardia wallacei]|uniref:hypothetical protein n=1 Tax=Nocardia wallacei TaxID=480035 RepID=UPI00245536DA|nr:hypothetical protein [Nocardia wallacei]